MHASPAHSIGGFRGAVLKYIRVVQWSAAGDSVHLDMLGEDQEIHRFDVGSECAGILAAALASESQKLHLAGKEQQLIRPASMQTARNEQGEPMIILTLKGGAELPLVFKTESLGVLISELQGLMRSVEPGSQIRWN
ncbi:MAG: hypothetical protein KF730_17090 [Sphingomonas sp.]|uniref:hypothetical protein n=1 Tax=Sphingomonas sp. TaxID=28214 RepID=UPI0025F02DB5|nr:hypothetical protein [Sphingomonas sp.]MBX3566279.1 hypothetical protein [Sphingomonas sp.]